MKKIDYHLHSSFSEDCSIEMKEMVEGAIKAGVNILCFTEHKDFDYPHEEFTFHLDNEAYTNRFLELKEVYKKDITLYRGVEMGLQKHVLTDIDNFVKVGGYDFVIGSQHCVDNKELYYKTYFQGKTMKEIFRGYYDELLYNITNFNNFDVVGHLDLIRRYSDEAVAFNFHEVMDRVEVILRKLISDGKGIEVNAGGFFYPTAMTNPHPSILKLYKELGREIITYGSDAHVPQKIGANYERTMDILKEAGFRYISYFADRKVEFERIR